MFIKSKHWYNLCFMLIKNFWVRFNVTRKKLRKILFLRLFFMKLLHSACV